MRKRQLSEKFMNDLLNGCLTPLLKEIQEDDTLCLELRGNFDDINQKDEAVNIYYRGGSLFKITRKDSGYEIFFETKYLENVNTLGFLKSNPNIDEAVREIALYKQAMDKSQKILLEKEFQQLIARVNNRIESNDNISNGTDYFIVDLEYQTSAGDVVQNGFRADMVAIKWESTSWDRKNVNKPTLALIEVKYGKGSIQTTKTSPGLCKHLEDMNAFLGDSIRVKEFCDDMSIVFKQKCELGLVKGIEKHKYNICISDKEPEIIFIIADYKPSSDVLKRELTHIDLNKYKNPIKIAMSSMMGYGLYNQAMIDLKQMMMNLGISLTQYDK